MSDGCPYLEYRDGDGRFPVERAYCAAAGRFVQPMRADVCNDRHGLAHAEDCEIYREHEGLRDLEDGDADTSEATEGAAEP